MSPDWAPYLDPDERIVWQGAPRRGVQRWPGLAFMVLGVPFLVAGPFMIREGLGLGVDIGLFLDIGLIAAGAVFTGLGAYLCIGQWIAEATRHARIAYALTDRRALIRDGRKITCVPVAAHPVDVTLSDDGSGSVLLGHRDKWTRQRGREGFIDIDGAGQVAALLQNRSEP